MTTKTVPFNRNPLGAWAFGPQALSLVGHDGKTSLRSSLRACNAKTPARGTETSATGCESLADLLATVAAVLPW